MAMASDDRMEWKELNLVAEKRATNSPIAPMPSLSHLTMKDYDQVYEPAEDTFLFLDALQFEFKQGSLLPVEREPETPFVVIEIGCGSGVVSTFFRSQWKKYNYSSNRLQSYVSDINQTALKVSLQTDKVNNYTNDSDPSPFPPVEAIHCDLASALLPRLQNQVDVILFNPPYVPTEDDEVVTETNEGGISAAWAGGKDGRRVIDRSIPQISQLLRRPTGVAYLVTVDENHPSQLNSSLLEPLELTMKPLFRRRAKNEFLSIQKITWKDSKT